MNYIAEIIIATLLSLYVIFELIRVNFYNKVNNSVLVMLLSMLLTGFGMYILVRYGLILDYKSEAEITSSHAQLMIIVAFISLSIGLAFVAVAFLKFLIKQVKN